MVDTLKSARDEDQRKRDESQLYNVQQQIDELRRQLKENLARQQWFEELYKQGEGRTAQLQLAQDRLAQDVAQALHARQIDDSRTKGQLSELAQRVEAPDKQIAQLRAQLQDLAEARKGERDVSAASQRQLEDLQRQIREINSHVGQVGEAQRHVRETIDDLRTTIGEVRQEALHVADLQRMEEQRLRRQGVELQGLFEALRQQFTEIAAKSQRVDDVRRQLTERIDAVEQRMNPIFDTEEGLKSSLEQLETLATEQYLAQQERLENVRLQLETQLGEQRQINDQRIDRSMSRFTATEERLRAVEASLNEMPSRFEALERRDEVIGSETDSIEEWLVMRQLAAMQTVLEDVRKRRADRAPTLNPHVKPAPDSTPGSIYNPSGLIKSVRDAKPPTRSVDEVDNEES